MAVVWKRWIWRVIGVVEEVMLADEFEHGSTIIVFAPPEFRLCDDIREGTSIRMGRALMHLP